MNLAGHLLLELTPADLSTTSAGVDFQAGATGRLGQRNTSPPRSSHRGDGKLTQGQRSAYTPHRGSKVGGGGGGGATLLVKQESPLR